MTLADTIFNIEFKYNAQLVDKLICRIQSDIKEERKNNIKYLVFKMMKNVVCKNILNYLNLLRGLNLRVEETPDSDDLISDCYVVYNHCVDKYLVRSGYNFYFYFNKALTRNFFRLYTRAKTKLNRELEIEDESVLYNRIEYSTSNGSLGSVELLMELLQFNDIEIRICRSRLSGQKNIDFLKENLDVTNSQYNSTLRVIKEKLIKYQQEGEL